MIPSDTAPDGATLTGTTSDGLAWVRLPADGVWRIGRRPDPLAARPPLTAGDLGGRNAGNRFDSPNGAYRVTYLASDRACAFGEVLARFRVTPALAALVQQDWEAMHAFPPGQVPAAWRHERLLVRVGVPSPPCFLDLEHPSTRHVLEQDPVISGTMVQLGVAELDVPAFRSGDRRLTRALSAWTYDRQQFAGIRYFSRLRSADWVCWAVFDYALLREHERVPIERDDAALEAVAREYGLRVY